MIAVPENIELNIKRLFHETYPELDSRKLIIKPSGPGYKMRWNDGDFVNIEPTMVDPEISETKIIQQIKSMMG